MDCTKILQTKIANQEKNPKEKKIPVPVLNKQSNLYLSQEGSTLLA